MAKPKTLDQLRAEKEGAETQLAQEQHKLERLENRKKYLEKGERTKRILYPSFCLQKELLHIIEFELKSIDLILLLEFLHGHKIDVALPQRTLKLIFDRAVVIVIVCPKGVS